MLCSQWIVPFFHISPNFSENINILFQIKISFFVKIIYIKIKMFCNLLCAFENQQGMMQQKPFDSKLAKDENNREKLHTY